MDFEGAKYVYSPTPRDLDSQAAIWEGLRDGTFDLFSSDHCPFYFEGVNNTGKDNDRARTSFKWVPNGIPGVETRLPILFSEGSMRGRIDLPRFVALSSTNHAKTYGLYPRKGTIAIGADADLAIWDPAATRTIRHADLHDASDYSPYEGLEVTGWPTTIIRGGAVVVDDGVLGEGARSGRYIPRNRSNLAGPTETDVEQSSTGRIR